MTPWCLQPAPNRVGTVLLAISSSLQWRLAGPVPCPAAHDESHWLASSGPHDGGGLNGKSRWVKQTAVGGAVCLLSLRQRAARINGLSA